MYGIYEAVAIILHKYPDYNVTFTTNSQGEDESLPSIQISDAQIQASIKDQGIGISDAELDYISQPFYQATNARTVKSNGIGLLLTEKIITLHGGSIEVRSVLNQRTTFTVCLPYRHSGVTSPKRPSVIE